MLSLYVYVVF